MNFKEIIKSIENENYQPIYFLNGENTYFIDKISDKLLNSVLEDSEKDFNETLELVKNLKFLNSYSFIFSPRPGTTASNYDQIDKKILKERLKVLQEILFNNQKIKNKSFENNQVNVLVENKMKNQDKFFGRNEYMTSVIFNGNESLVGKIIPVKINNSNQNSLFGEILTNDVEAA